MSSSLSYDYLIPFPHLPGPSGSRYAAGRLMLRSFGHLRQDLEIDFRGASRPHLVTQILKCCTRNGGVDKPDESFYWDLTVGKRIEILSAIATEGGQTALSVKFICAGEKCAEMIEFNLNQEDVAQLQQRADVSESISLPVRDKTTRFRLPTGDDQRNWLAKTYSDKRAAVRDMAQTLMLPNQSDESDSGIEVSDDTVDVLNRVISEQDPLTAMAAGVICPGCSLKNKFMFDLEGMILKKLRLAQQKLLYDIHILAAVYHWSEYQILSIPRWRRRQYLRLIDMGRKK